MRWGSSDVTKLRNFSRMYSFECEQTWKGKTAEPRQRFYSSFESYYSTESSREYRELGPKDRRSETKRKCRELATKELLERVPGLRVRVSVVHDHLIQLINITDIPAQKPSMPFVVI